MIAIQFQKRDFEYDVYNLVKSFYPEEEIVLSDDDSPAAEYDEKISLFYGKNKISIRIERVSGDRKRQEEGVWLTEEMHGRKERKNQTKILLYHMLQKRTGQELPWGTLTGVRPTKIPMALIDAGHSNVETAKIMREQYLVSREKTALAVSIANRERHILEDIDYKNGYSLYIGIPFCPTTCLYCSFTSFPICAWKNRVSDYLSAVEKEIDFVKETCADRVLDSVYIGGGTPTCLGADYLSEILQAVGACFAIAENAEITVECNPESTDQAVLEAMHKHGVNRLSFGVQAAHDTELKRIGRIHDFAQAQTAVQLARQCGFANISLDLMYGLPDQTQAQFLDSVTQCLTLNPQHLSCYGLKLEPATPMGRENPVLPDDDTQADTYLAMCRLLSRNGFEHYEISNFAKPGFRSRHNFKYWDLSDYLGLGPGAHSFLNGRRFAFVRDIRAYISGESIPQDEEEVSDFRRQGEYLLVRLRTSDGADMHDLENRYHVSTAPYEQVFRMLEKHGLAAHEGTRWYLTEQGFLVSNSIINTVVEAGE